jgi:hypothetical protein
MDRREFVETLGRAFDESGVIAPEGFFDRICNLAEVYAGVDENLVTIRGTLGRETVHHGDSTKEIKVEVSLYNTPRTRVALAMLGSAAVNIVGVQADLESYEPKEHATLPKDKAQTDLEEYCAENDPREKLKALLPSEEVIKEFTNGSAREDWWLDADILDLDDEEGARFMGAMAATHGEPKDNNPFVGLEGKEPLRAAWFEAHEEAAALSLEIHQLERAQQKAEESDKWPGLATADSNGNGHVPAVNPWQGKTKAQLREELKRRGVEYQASANKDELIAELERAIDEAGPTATDDIPADESDPEDAEMELAEA